MLPFGGSIWVYAAVSKRGHFQYTPYLWKYMTYRIIARGIIRKWYQWGQLGQIKVKFPFVNDALLKRLILSKDYML